jgi:predicted metal-dependent peptidase
MTGRERLEAELRAVAEMPERGDASPLPGLEVPHAEVLDAAWTVLEAQAERRDPTPIARRAIARFAKDLALGVDVLEKLAARWILRDGPLEHVRAAEGGAGAPGWFSVDQARELIVASREEHSSRAFTRGVWRVLVRHGWAPDKARLAAWGWSPESGTLPNGQWIPPELLGSDDAASASALPQDLVHELMGLLAHSQLRALRRLRQATGCSLEDAQLLLVALVERRRTGADARSEARVLLDDAICALMLDRPFHWALLDAAHVVEDDTVPTMAVGVTTLGEIAIFYQPDFVRRLTEEQRKGVLLHEVHHVLFDHLHPPPDASTGATAWTLACEVTANEYVPYALPEPITIEELDLPPGESTKERFARLARRKKLASEWGPRMRAAEKDRVVRPLDPNPRSHDDFALGPRNARAALEAAAARAGTGIDRETREMLAAPGLVAFEDLLPVGEATLAWNELLRVLVRGLLVRTSTRTYPSRRLPDKLGVAPGRRARRERPVVMAVIDTSASMSSGELAQVSAELGRLAREHVRVACLQCDDEIRKREWLGADATIVRVHGRGGTDLRPPFAEAELRRARPDLVVYFTDGHGPAPDHAPLGISVLWVLTGASARVPTRFGRAVRMRPRSAAR